MGDVTKKWFDAVEAVSKERAENPPMPIAVLLQEAQSVLDFKAAYWEPVAENKKTGVAARPGLSQSGGRLSAATFTEIEELVTLLIEAKREVLRTAPASTATEDNKNRARFLIRELGSALEWLFDDGVEDEKDQQLDTVVSAHADDGDGAAELAGQLEDFHSLALDYKAELVALPTFDAAVLDEAPTSITTLRAVTPGSKRSNENKAALLRRNRIAWLLQERIQTVRDGARYVYRRHPDLAAQVGSAYQRTRRLAARLAAKKKAEAPKS